MACEIERACDWAGWLEADTETLKIRNKLKDTFHFTFILVNVIRLVDFPITCMIGITGRIKWGICNQSIDD